MGAHGSKSPNSAPNSPATKPLQTKNSKIVNRMTETQISEFKDAFDSVDLDRSGEIDATELKKLCEWCGEILTDDDVARMMAMADTDGSGKIDFWEFVTLMVCPDAAPQATHETLTRVASLPRMFPPLCSLQAYKMSAPSPQDALMTAFQALDQDGSGTVSEKEMLDLMRELGEPVDVHDFASVFNEIDVNGDKTISYDEFVMVVTKEMKEGGYQNL